MSGEDVGNIIEIYSNGEIWTSKGMVKLTNIIWEKDSNENVILKNSSNSAIGKKSFISGINCNANVDYSIAMGNGATTGNWTHDASGNESKIIFAIGVSGENIMEIDDKGKIWTKHHKKIEPETAAGAPPIGSVIAKAGVSGEEPPYGWLWCDGKELSFPPLPEYQALFLVIGTLYGGMGGKFNVPNISPIVVTTGPNIRYMIRYK